MDDRQAMLEALVRAIEQDYRASVAFAVIYGSYVAGQMSPKSDVDVVFAGKDQRAYDLQRTFIYDGVGYDFFCMPVERVRRIVDEFQPLVSVFATGRLLWADSQASADWFADMQRGILTAGQTSGPTRYLSQIEALLTQMKALVFDHRSADTSEKQHIQGRLVLLFGDFLARVNRSYFRFGIRRYLDEIGEFQLKPEWTVRQLQGLMLGAVPSDDLSSLVHGAQQFWVELKERSQITEGTLAASLPGFYEEAVSGWNKIQQAARVGDARLTYLAAVCLEDELKRLRSAGLPLTSMFSGNASGPEEIAANAAVNQRQMLDELMRRRVPIVEFDDLADVIAYIEGKESPADDRTHCTGTRVDPDVFT